MKPPKVLVADSIAESGVAELSRDGALEVSVRTGLKEPELIAAVPEFSGIVVRSQPGTGTRVNFVIPLRGAA